MFVIFDNGKPVVSFTNQDSAVDYWKTNGGTIVLYPDLEETYHVVRR